MRVSLEYFKPDTGKYYSSGEYESSKKEIWEVYREVREMAARRKLPGLMDGSVFIIYIRVPDHPHDVPQVVLPKFEFTDLATIQRLLEGSLPGAEQEGLHRLGDRVPSP